MYPESWGQFERHRWSDAQSPRASGLKKHRGQRRLFGFLTVRRWLQLARSLSATRWETLRRVIVPGVLGHVLTGVRLAIGILWIVLGFLPDAAARELYSRWNHGVSR